MLQLGIVLRRDLVHRGQQGVDNLQVRLEFVLPRWQVHVGEADLDLAADLAAFVTGHWQVVVLGIQPLQRFRKVTHRRRTTGLIERGNLGQRRFVVGAQRLQGEPERLH